MHNKAEHKALCGDVAKGKYCNNICKTRYDISSDVPRHIPFGGGGVLTN